MTDFLIQLGLDPASVAAFRLDILGRLLLASLLGGVIGMERELSGKPAGLRTNLLICLGAALLTSLSIDVATLANVPNTEAGIAFRADPARIAAQIVSGIGFLGAGTILVARGEIMGLTTAATIWVVAAIGMAIGAEAFIPAIGTTALVVAALFLLGRWESFVDRRGRRERYRIVFDSRTDPIGLLERAFGGGGMRMRTEGVTKSKDRTTVSIKVHGPIRRHREALRQLIGREDVYRVTTRGKEVSSNDDAL